MFAIANGKRVKTKPFNEYKYKCGTHTNRRNNKQNENENENENTKKGRLVANSLSSFIFGVLLFFFVLHVSVW